MSTVEGFERPNKYNELMEKFRAMLETEFPVKIETGRKFDKLYVVAPDGRQSLFMVDRHTWDVYGTKSWTQVNLRRWYGTLETIDQMSWHTLVPVAGTDLARAIDAREASIKAKYGKRGRPPKVKV